MPLHLSRPQARCARHQTEVWAADVWRAATAWCRREASRRGRLHHSPVWGVGARVCSPARVQLATASAPCAARVCFHELFRVGVGVGVDK
eukprot:365175-Chlamydomonas_euryale.AAC.12